MFIWSLAGFLSMCPGGNNSEGVHEIEYYSTFSYRGKIWYYWHKLLSTVSECNEVAESSACS